MADTNSAKQKQRCEDHTVVRFLLCYMPSGDVDGIVAGVLFIQRRSAHGRQFFDLGMAHIAHRTSPFIRLFHRGAVYNDLATITAHIRQIANGKGVQIEQSIGHLFHTEIKAVGVMLMVQKMLQVLTAGTLIAEKYLAGLQI